MINVLNGVLGGNSNVVTARGHLGAGSAPASSGGKNVVNVNAGPERSADSAPSVNVRAGTGKCGPGKNVVNVGVGTAKGAEPASKGLQINALNGLLGGSSNVVNARSV